MNDNIAKNKTRKRVVLIGLSMVLLLIIWAMKLMNNYNIFKFILISGIFLGINRFFLFKKNCYT
ncbi:MULTISPECIES: hypothetical protein [unclassified Clostridioides]|uniref:hypothetical protein n=1 Tax=unclassified Clostridioides TaxID=2635829 RepID=UPI001D125DDB|nr:hypothetical protein [Clostridioides sp. ZZV14-6048]MCC0739971.1 hypothetical protein [Clostridioides sp. ZZV14-5902]